MYDQAKHRPYSPSDFFEDGQSSRPLIPGTVARGHLRADEAFFAGKSEGKLVAAIPVRVDRPLLERGRERYAVFCTPCHDPLGTGEGPAVLRGYRRPPSLHIDRLREVPPGHFYDVITRGFGAMPDHAAQIPPPDRWAIVAYLRALQRSRNASRADVPEEELKRLEAMPR